MAKKNVREKKGTEVGRLEGEKRTWKLSDEK
jgi:hypothetical protein